MFLSPDEVLGPVADERRIRGVRPPDSPGPRSCAAWRASAAGAVVHTSRLLSLGEDLPLAIVIVDSAERVRAFLPQLRELMTTGLATVEEVKVVHGTGGADGR